MTPAVDFPVPNGVLEKGDIVHSWSDTLVSQGIRLVNRANGAGKVVARHTAGVSRPNVPQLICEAVAEGAKENPLRTLDMSGRHAIIIRWPGLPDEKKETIVQVWRHGLGKGYPISDLSLHVLDRIVFKGEYRMRRLSWWNARRSTSFILNGYREAGYTIDQNAGEMTPDDLLRYQLKQGHQIVWASSNESLRTIWELYGRARE